MTKDKAMIKTLIKENDDLKNEISKLREQQPTRQKGKWIVKNINEKNTLCCSVCGEEALFINEEYPIFCKSRYCSNCGAKMEVE